LAEWGQEIREGQLAKREQWTIQRRLAVEFLLVAGLGAAFGAMGPFGSYASPLDQRVPLWVGNMLCSHVILRPVFFAGAWLAAFAAFPPLVGRMLALALGAVPLTLLIDLSISIQVPHAPEVPFSTRYLQVCGIGLAVRVLLSLFFASERADASSLEKAAPARPPFFDRLPAEFQDRLYCLSMEDHYVRAHSPVGSTLLLMRLRDAVAELRHVPGMRVHRSWWVALDAVERLEREGSGLRLVLANGFRVPVARSYEGAVKAHRWPFQESGSVGGADRKAPPLQTRRGSVA
jgi:hypothetical protein